jgi:UPF0716 family protein affecting phage T7 exclusion
MIVILVVVAATVGLVLLGIEGRGKAARTQAGPSNGPRGAAPQRRCRASGSSGQDDRVHPQSLSR